ncbi:MAG: hypothetical protein ABIP51_23230 [Bacteroidia bacterium]
MSINKFQYSLSPESGGGGTGGTGGTSPVVSYSSIPANKYIDISDFQNYTIGLYNFNYIDYYMDKVNNSTIAPQLIDIIGANISSGHTYTNLTPTSGATVVIKRLLTGLGVQKDRILIDSSLYGSYQYLTLQRSVPVVQYITLVSGTPDITTNIAPNSTTTLTPSQIFRLTKSLSRGAEISSVWSIYKTDPAGSFLSVPAVVGVDYSITGTLTSNSIDLQFLTNYNFEVRLNIAGYTFQSNPYLNLPSDTAPNSTTAIYYFQAATVSSTFNYEIKLPKLSPSTVILPSTSIVETSPLTTYQNQVISITAVPETSVNCYWKKIDLTGGLPPVLLLKSDSEWIAELTSKCNITFEIRRISNNEIILTKLVDITSPFDITIQPTGDFNMQFITTLK